ncbi:hypothetical protein [Arthrobacter sp. ISL-65]|uniref:hypothetical protein n=1 Tax=Arthrobacter sp. ISL-65 TaxID=2819112 RepID=UPI001BEC3059|nr:hypothetical protein [Arthrobacter sp. ISL-65]MBT2550205.1 hypothetical protein [Arthrobacter sp. ISL-65]
MNVTPRECAELEEEDGGLSFVSGDAQDLELLEATPFENGVALLRYEVKNQVEKRVTR